MPVHGEMAGGRLRITIVFIIAFENKNENRVLVIASGLKGGGKGGTHVLDGPVFAIA